MVHVMPVFILCVLEMFVILESEIHLVYVA